MTATVDMDRIIASASRLGVEVDGAEAVAWMEAVNRAREDHTIVLDEDSGVFGHGVTLLDFSPDDLAWFRTVGAIVEIPNRPGVATALALSGSAAQSKVQTYPGDCDYFERVHIVAPTRDEACALLASTLRDTAIERLEGPTYRLTEVKFGEWPVPVVRDGEELGAGSPIAWNPQEIRAGVVETTSLDGRRVSISWGDAALEPGWCKLDWVVADPIRGALANASNMLDVTWEAPDGTITPLDGYLDPYFQEVYLDADSLPLFTRLVERVSTDALDEYVRTLEKEVVKYTAADPRNYGKAAKRMYNIFRLNGRYREAAFLRELFDEPTALLYQVGAVLRTVEEALDPRSPMTLDVVRPQVDDLMESVVAVLAGEQEQEVVGHLRRLHDLLEGDDEEVLEQRGRAVDAARAELANVVNNFFHDKLTGLPEIAGWLEELHAKQD